MKKSWFLRGAALTALCLLVLGSAGCAGLLVPKEDQLLPAARYAELETYMEAKIPDISSAPTSRLWYLCYAYSRLKKYNKLFPCIDRLERNVEQGDDTANLFNLSSFPTMLRAEALLDLGEYRKAVEQAQRSYEIVNKKDLSRGMRIYTLGILGLSHALNGDREKAKEYTRLLEGIGTYYPFTFLKTDKLNGLARIYMALGDFQKSLERIREDESIAWARSFAEAAAFMTGAMPSGNSVFAYQQLPKAFILNKSLYETGAAKEAKTGYDALLKDPRTRDNTDIYWMILFDRGKIAEAEGLRGEAIDFYRRTVDIIEEQRSTINTEASKIGFVGDKQKVYSRLIGVLFAEGRFSEAFEYVERSKSRALVDLLATKRDFAVKAGDEKQVLSLLETREKAETQVLAQDLSPERSSTRSVIVTAKRQLRDQSPELASLISVTSRSSSELQSLVPAGEALVEYYYSERDMLAFVLTRDGMKAMRLSGDGLVEEVRRFRAYLENPSAGDDLSIAQSLYRRLIAPLEDSLRGRHLIIVPHGVLHYLPFNALHDGKGFLIDSYGIRILPSASVMEYLRAGASPKPRDILALGNPDLGDPRYDLVHAQEEAQAVARTRSQSTVLLRKNATETAFRKFGSGFRYVHFATHGQFDSDAPLRSALLLAGDSENDGRLSVDKLYSMRMDADLVTLSACETGLGKVASGDDVVGLTRGFLYAGSRSVVASLWKVDDLATAQLMTDFYEGLKKTGKREALRAAQLNTKRKYSHPYYWASFQLTGNAH